MLERVVSDLLGSPVSSKWVGVHGVGGAGKTLLAKRVCENHQVKEHFDPVLWLTFGQTCQVEAKQAELANQIRLESRISNETLRRGLAGKRCLMVLDDVWTSGDLLDLFDVVQENGSKIFITTRKLDVLDSRGAIKTKMGLLGKEDSLKLFTVHAYPNQKYAQNQVKKIVMEQVVEKCGGLPLVLKVIGRRMAGKQDWDFVLGKLNDQQLATLDEEQQVLQRLKLGYDALLPLGIQQHFLFFAAFPEDRQIGFWDLFKCWKGEGLVANTAEAVNVLERLKNHALITDEENSPGGRWLGDKRYRIHDALLALALHILEQEGPKCYFKVGCSNAWDAFTSNYSKISLVGCRLPIGKNRVTVSSTTCMLLDQNYFHLTSLPSLSLFKSLKVLCLSRSGVVTLPHSIGKLKNLQTLDLSWNTSLQSIPDSLGKLTNLSYLDLGNCRTLETFPVDALLKLTNLVYINGENNFAMWTCHRLHHRLFKHKKCLNRRFGLHLDGMFQALTKLEVLIIHTMLAVELPASIGELSNLKELEIRGQTRVTYDSFRCLTNLESVKLQELDLPLSDWDWSRFPRLRTLEVGGLNGECEFKVTSSMENLQTLVIGWNHHLECLPFLTQEMLPMLTSLSLSNCENLTEVLTISQLASLKDLSIWMCPSLKDLPISFLPNLGILYLSSCDKVTTLNISECPSLRRVKIDSFGMLACVAFGGKFPRLQEIFLEGFENLPDVSLGAMDAFPQLTRLEIESCGIHQLPEWYASFTKLRALNLRHLENLDVIPDGVARLPLLRELDLMGCRKISMLPSAD
ncbi:putative disease resistance protein RGA4 [Selaginella moellendorffii]|uniref:putative disease resistance protein RGA4 n=1 Tax=Selaginella moellendorffii TaxID=88036 RepID=UPI000D1CE671|nr:putative disease resistance protein RGA4 [Selaginella moellendorffii]|eukprot:XP_002991947.2 putative disease resistance protein RGA4 [Selaginella moellendorffii]